MLIHLINFLFRHIEVNVKRRPSYHTWSKVFSTSRNIPAVGWPLEKPSLIVSKSLNELSFVLLFFFETILLFIKLFITLSPIANVVRLFQEVLNEAGSKTKGLMASY